MGNPARVDEHYCERCLEGLGSKKTQAVGQYFIDFKKILWLCKHCVSLMSTMYGHDLRERERFEKQIRALIDK